MVDALSSQTSATVDSIAHAGRSAGFRPDIEGLRALAVSLVVVFHLGFQGLPGGYIGVDVFFVISGYLITGLLLDEIARTGRLDLVAFYGRRARRLLPTSVVVLAATLLAAGLVLAPKELLLVGKSAVASAAYVSNFWFLHQARDYFAPESALNPFLHTWSLSVEEQFYFVWPVLLLLVARAARTRLQIALFIIAASAVSLAVCLWVVTVKQSSAFYASPTRVWEFGVGALATLAPTSVLQGRGRLAAALAWTGLAGVVASAVWMSERTLFPGVSALIPVVGTALILLAGKASGGMALPFLASRPMQYLGRQSYAIYLWHWPVVVLAVIVWPQMGLLRILACLFGTLALARLTFRFVESPTRASASLWAGKRLVLLLGAVLTLVGGVFGGGTMLLARSLEHHPNQMAVIRGQTELSVLAEQNCLADLSQTKPIDCRFGDPHAPLRMVLFGDSHAAQWFTPVQQIARENNAELVAVLKSSCAVSEVPVLSFRLRRLFTECEAWRGAAIQKIIDIHPDAVILSQHSLSYVRQAGVERSAASVSSDEWTLGLQRTLSAFQTAGIPTVVIADTPDMRFDVPTCVGRSSRWGALGHDCGQDRQVALNAQVAAAERRAVAAIATARYVDMTDVFCPGATCSPVRDGALLYRDANHIAESAALAAVAALKVRMGPLVSRGNAAPRGS